MGYSFLREFSNIYPAKKSLKKHVRGISLVNIPLTYSLPSIDIMSDIPREFIDIPQLEIS